jgi:two-component system, cell cycle sensor histidine kinase and response regulator CckA
VSAEGSAGKLDPTPQLSSAFHETRQMVEALLESASQAILSVDSSGKIVLANQRAEEMFNYTREELLGAPIEMLLPESKRASHAHQREQYFAQPGVRPMGIGMELAGRKRNGEEFPVEVSLSAIHTREGVFAIAFVTDISQRKQLEEQLVHALKMEAVGRLAGGVAHDFNNMLTVISGYSRMILEELREDDPLRDYAQEIGTAAERAGAITKQLLAFSRRQLLEPRVIGVNAVILQIENMLRRLLGEDIQLTLDLAPNVANIKADPNHLEQGIVNLAVNARDAMPSGGHIFLQTASVHLDETYVRTHLGVQPGDFVMIAMTDTGHGMDAETRKRIFEPFFTTKERGKGTGLGLASVYGMVKQGGGDIWVYSEPGKGTTFKLYFPKVQLPVETASRETESFAQPVTATVLVVEDEQAVRELTVRMLQRLGYSVLSAASGGEAIEMSKSFAGRIAFLLTDVVMPGMSGRQVADAVLAMRPDLRVLFVSGYTEHATIHQEIGAGVNFLAKPFSRETLARKLVELANSARRASA